MAMTEPHALVGSTVLQDFQVDAVVRSNPALVSYAATSLVDQQPCTLWVSQSLQVDSSLEPSIQSAASRLARHCVGVSSIAPPRSAGMIEIDSTRLFAMVHVGDPRDSLEDRILSGLPLPIHEVARLLGPVAQALEAIHAQGLTHGALHPAAIMFSPRGYLLSGFGLSEIASLINGAVGARDVVPPRSRTPEQVGIVPSVPSADSDLYALAMIACELLVGRPFTSEASIQDIARAIDNPNVRPTPANFGVPISDHLDKIFAHALDIQPRDRRTTPTKFLSDLRAPAPAVPAAVPAAKPAAPMPATPEPAPPIASQAQQPAAPPQAAKPQPGSMFKQQVPNKPSSSAAWLVYLFVGMGALILVAGVGAVFVFSIMRTPPPPAPTVTVATTTATPPPTAPPTVSAEPEPSETADPTAPPTASVAPSAAASGPTPKITSGNPPLAADDSPLVPIGRETPVFGPRDAPVTIVMFADMQCPYTRKVRPEVWRLLADRPTDVRLAIRQLPLSVHKQSDLVAEVGAITASLAGPQAFARYFESVSLNAGGLTPTDVSRWAQEAGVSPGPLRKAIDDRSYRKVIEADMELAGRLMVHGTPTFFINGKRVDGIPRSPSLSAIVDDELRASQKALSSGVPISKLYATRVVFNVTSAEADGARPSPRRRP